MSLEPTKTGPLHNYPSSKGTIYLNPRIERTTADKLFYKPIVPNLQLGENNERRTKCVTL